MSLFRPAFTLLLVFTVLLGLVYPFAITGIARVAFPAQAEGSLLHDGERVVGSSLIGQPFADPAGGHREAASAYVVAVLTAPPAGRSRKMRCE